MKRLIAFILVLVMIFTFSVEAGFAAAADKPVRQKITSILPGNHKLSIMWNKVEGDNVKYLIRIASDENFTKDVKDITIKGSDND